MKSETEKGENEKSVTNFRLDLIARTPGIVKCNNPLKLNPFGLV